MIYNSKDYVERDLERQMSLKKKYEKMFYQMPEGRLVSSKIHGSRYYYKVNGSTKKYLGNASNEEVIKLQKKHYLKKSIMIMDTNIKLMKRMIKGYQSIDPNLIISAMGVTYRPLPQSCYDIAGAVDLKRWANKAYQKSRLYPEQLKHKTESGIMVRSKSEVLIANMLTAKGIPYRYEQELELGDITLVPDFTVAKEAENKMIYHEHCGLMGDNDYFNHALWKLKTYIENGLLLWRDVIFTFDDYDGNIDTDQIGRIIDSFYL